MIDESVVWEFSHANIIHNPYQYCKIQQNESVKFCDGESEDLILAHEQTAFNKIHTPYTNKTNSIWKLTFHALRDYHYKMCGIYFD